MREDEIEEERRHLKVVDTKPRAAAPEGVDAEAPEGPRSAPWRSEESEGLSSQRGRVRTCPKDKATSKGTLKEHRKHTHFAPAFHKKAKHELVEPIGKKGNFLCKKPKQKKSRPVGRVWLGPAA